MRLAVFYVWGCLLAFSVCDICPETSEDAASWVKLKPLGHCGDEDNLCPYRLTLPPLSIQLPRPFRELEKMAKELQNLKQVVNQLRRDCQECKDRHSLERGERTDHIEKEERGPQSPRHSIGIGHSGEQDVQIHTSTLLQGDRSESEGAIKGGMKSLNYPILEGQEWNIDPTIDLNEGTTNQRSEMSREVKIFNPSLDEVPEGISKITPVPTPVGKEWELKSKRSELIEPSLPRKKDEVHSATPRKQLPDILRDGRVKNISGILTVRRVQNVPDPNRLSSTLRNANMQTMDLSTSAGNRKVVKPSGTGGTLRPKGSYINNRAVKVNNEDRLRNPALVRNTNPQDGDITIKIEPEEAGFSPARSGIMRVKETSPRMANTKPGTISGSTPLKDDQNKQDISRDSGPKTDDGQTLKDSSQASIIRENNLRNINKTDIAKLSTTLKQEKESDMTHTDSNKSVSNIMNQAEQENMDKEEKKHTGLSESLVVISSEAETIINTDREDMPFSGRQVENEKYLNPITKTNNGQIGSKVLDKADSNLNSRTVNPESPDLKDKTLPETFTEGGNEETAFNSLNSETEKNIPSHSIASLSEKDLVQPTIVPTVKGRLISTVRRTSRVKSPVAGHGIIRTSKTPLKTGAELSQNSNKDISKIREVSQEIRYVMPGTTVISPKGPKLGQFNMTNKIPSKLPIPFRNGNTARTNVSGIVKPYYTRRKSNFQTEANTNRGIKTKVSTVTQFFSPTGASSTVEQVQTEEIEHIPQVIRSHLLDNHRLKNITEIKSQPESQNVGDVRDLNKFQEENNRAGFNSEGVLISNTENSAEDPITIQSETSNSPTSERERKIFSLGTADINSQHPSELDKISNWKKRPTAPTLKKELRKEPGTNRFTTSTVSFTDTGNEDSTKNIHTVTNTTKHNSQDAQKGVENISATPNKRSNALHNRWLRNNSTESKPRPQNLGNADLDKVQKGKNQTGDNSKTVLISNIENGAEDPNALRSGESNLPTGGKESKMPILATVESSSQVKVDRISSGQKRPTAPTLKKELSKKPGTTQFTTSTVSFTDTDLEGSTKAIHSMTNTHVEMAKNVNLDTPISYENIGATRELELIKLNKDRVEENPGEVLSNPNSGNTDQGYREERYTIPVVLETLANVEEIKGSKLFSLSPEDTAEGFKSHSVSDEVTQREQAENEIHSTCLGDCNTTPTQHSQPSTAQTRTPFVSGREKGPAQDCADYMSKSRRNGVYRVTPRPKNSTFPVFCDMESSGGGWTLIQHRFDGSTSFNRTWDEYKNGFGKLIEEFWLGNDKIHFLTKAKNMSLRIEIEDFEGNREYAHYDHFYVANETQQYRLSIGGYSGTAGDAMQFNNKYNHDQKLFTTPDRDNDQYPSGNCGAYYSSGWWFDACMSANLNGKYYQSKYKGVRNGIFWGTWHNITMEYYPTNDRQSFKTVRMMIRPKNYAN